MNYDLHEILRHALGLSAEQRSPTRNHFLADEGSKDFLLCEELVKLLMATREDELALTNGSALYTITEKGIEFAMVNLPTPLNMTPGQKRILNHLQSDQPITFRDVLTKRLYRVGVSS